jgi:integrase
LAKVIWSDNLRQVLKREHGKGWSVRDHRGRVQLTRIFEDRSRSAVYLRLTWTADNATAILNTVAAIHDLMDSRKVSLKEAARLNTQALAGPASITKKAAEEGWDAVASDFLKSRDDRRSSTLRDLRLRVQRALAVINQKPKPRDGMSVLDAYAAAYFKEMAPGGQGRKRNLNDVVAFLQFAVDRCGAPDRFLPPPKDRINELIGTSGTSTTERLTPPIKEEQFTSLLDALAADNRHDLRLAVALVGYLGLRPAELAVLRVDDDGKARVGNIKRNIQTMKQADKPPRLVIPLEIEGRNNEGALAVAQFASGLVKLPKALRKQIDLVEQKGRFQDVGAEFAQQLSRCNYWQAMVITDPSITPYSLRHGFAWRATVGQNKLPVRTAAALMGHTMQVHHRHYGAWVDEAAIEEAVGLHNAAIT